MTLTVALFVIFGLYMECGRRTLQVLVLTGNPENGAYRAIRDNRMPTSAHIAWLLLWGPIMLISWLTVEARTLSRSLNLRTYP